MIKAPKLGAQNKLQAIVEKFNLEIRPTHGAPPGMYEISNRRKLGITEFDTVKQIYDGIAEIIQAEKSLK